MGDLAWPAGPFPTPLHVHSHAQLRFITLCSLLLIVHHSPDNPVPVCSVFQGKLFLKLLHIIFLLYNEREFLSGMKDGLFSLAEVGRS